MWLSKLKVNPIPSLLAWDDPALSYFIHRDLLDNNIEPVESLWSMAIPSRLTKKQQPDGSWLYQGKTYDPATGTNYSLIETYRTLRVLVEQYGFTLMNPTLHKAAEYIFTCQKPEGDIRGILGNQYMPYYHGAILELLSKAGFVDDPRVIRGMEWLLEMRQDDGGWLIPAQVIPAKQKTNEFWLSDPILPDRSRSHAHLATGMVLRAFAAHPVYKHTPEAGTAGDALKSRLFKPDKYNDRKASSYWLKFQYPYWWTNLLTALDTLYRLGFDKGDDEIARGLEWFIIHQKSDGLWDTGYGAGSRSQENRHWVGLAVCRQLKNYYKDTTNNL